MRNIGTLPTDAEATSFSGALYLRGIENDVEIEEDDTFSIWVHDDAQMAEARALLDRFRADPKASEFVNAPTAASRARAEARRAERARGSNVITRERMEYERTYQATAWLPMLLIFASIGVTILTDTLLQSGPGNLLWQFRLWISFNPFVYNLPEVRTGEVWRLITPIFIHYGPLHLIFNMSWLRSLGSFIVNRYGTPYFAVMVVVIAVASNLTQYFWNGPAFGGMSGVNYGLFGFLWMRGKFDRFAAWSLPPLIVQTMLIWFVLCFTPLLPGVANAAHFAGLALGMAWGFLSAKLSRGRS